MSGGVAVDFSALSRAGTSLAAGLEENRKQTLLQALGGQVQAGDYAGAAKTAFDAGDLQTGLSLVKLGDAKAQTADFQKQFGGGLAGILGGTVDPSTGTPAAPAPTAPVTRGPAFTDASGPAGSYLATLRGVESNGNRTAKNPNSSATGIDQFTAGTWEGLRKKYPELGLTPDGRTDVAQSTRAMERFTRDNAAVLTNAGVPITPGNLYVAHFLGAGGAARFIKGVQNNPDAPAASYVDPSSVAANRTIFYNRDGTPKTAGAVYAERVSRFGGVSPAARALGEAGGSDGRVRVASADPGFMPQMPSAAAGVSASPAGPAMTLPGGTIGPGGPTMTLPAEADPVPQEQRVQIAQAAPQVLVQAGMKPAAAATFNGMQPGSAQRIQWLVRAMSHPAAPEGAKEGMKALLANELQMDRENRQMTPDQKEYAWRVANGFRGSVEDMLAEKRKGADPAIIQEYEYAKRNNGYTGSLLDYTKSKAEAGATRVTQNANTNAENEQDKVAQKDLGDFQVKTREGNRAASSSLASIRVMKQLVDDPSFYSGTFGGLATEAKKAAASLGLGAADGARANEGFRKLSSQFILDKAGGSLGGGFSNGDRTFIEQTGPNIENTPAGNKLILEMAERVALRQQEVHRMMVEYKRAHNGRIDDGFLSQIDAYGQQNPVFAGLENMPGVAPARNPPPAGTPAPGQRDASTQGLKPAPADEIANARAAIASGIPAEKVMQKMRQRGFVPAGL